MKRLLLTMTLLWVIGIAANADEIPNDEIWYEASAKLTEVTYEIYSGLHTNAFNVSVSSHTFSDGKGIVKFKGDVTSIGENAFYNCSGLTSVNIPNSVKSIGENAFYKCSSLTSVTIPNSVTSIGIGAFYVCKGLTSVNIGNSVTSIGYDAFRGCSGLTSVNIGNSVTSIGNSAFYECSSLTSVNIPNSVTSIGNSAFYKCSGLTSVNIGNSVTSIGNSAFTYCSGLTSVNIPNSVTSIGNSAFSVCSGLTSVNIGNSVTSIGEYAFNGCSGLTSVNIPDSVKSIGEYAFEGCTSLPVENNIRYADTYLVGAVDKTLSTYYIKEGTKWIGYMAFCNCYGLTSVNIPNSVTSIGEYAFSGCISLPVENNIRYADTYLVGAVDKKLSTYTIKEGTKWIGSDAFYKCYGLTSVNIPNSVTSIGERAFNDCTGLTSITIPNSVTSIEFEAFSGCSGLTSVNIGNSVTSIGGHAFYKCTGLTSITIPNSVTSIGYDAFYDCYGLTSVNIPNSVTSIGEYAFEGCTSLPVENNIRYADTYLVGAVDKTLSTYYIKEGTKWIGSKAFANCSSLTSITIPNSVTSIGERAFNDCTGLTSITIPNSVTSIEFEAFSGIGLKNIYCLGTTPATLGTYAICQGGTVYVPVGAKQAYSNAYLWKDRTIYESFIADNFVLRLVNDSYLIVDAFIGDAGESDMQTIPSSAVYGDNTYNVTKINGSTFSGNTALTNVVMPNSIEAIGTYAFSGCSNLKSITLSKNITTLSDYAFQNCTSLENIAILAGTTSIGSAVFDGCKSLATVTMKNYVATIGSYCFRGCESLTSITLSKNITAIPSYAFQDCKSLPSVSLSGIASVGDYSYDGCTSISEVSVPANCTSIAESAFYRCTALRAFTVDAGNTAYATIDGVLTNKGQTQIVTFPSAKGTTYDIPSTITSIGQYAFRGCELASISIPATVKYVYPYAFADCPKLAAVRIEDTSSSLYLNDYSTRNSYTNTFRNSPVESLYIGRNITGYSSYYYTGSSGAFYNNATLKSVTVSGNATSLYSGMFLDCTSLSKVELSGNVTAIGSSAFQDCISLSSIALGNVTTIGSSAFQGCSSLAFIKLPATVSSIGDAFLSGCSGLREINAKMQTPPVLQATAFTDVDKDACKLIVPADYVETYGETPGWMAFNNIVAEESASLRKVALCLTNGGSVTIDSRTYTGEGSHSLYVSATEDVSVVITPDEGRKLSTLIVNGTDVTDDVVGNTYIIPAASLSTTIAVSFAKAYYVTAVDNGGNEIREEISAGDDVILRDDYKSLGISEEVEDVNIAYTRSFANSGVWQAWFVPFDADYDDMSRDYEVAQILGVLTDEDGKPYIAFGKMTSGVVKGNVPYVVKAKLSGDITTQTTSTLLPTTNLVQYTAQSMVSNFTFGGVYAETTNGDKGWYALNNDGNFQQMGEEVYLRPFRIYMTITPREDNPYGSTVSPGEVKMMVIGDDATDIDTIGMNGEWSGVNGVNLAGQSVDGSFKGIVIRGGKKFLVR